MSKPSPNAVLEIFSGIKPLLAQIGRALDVPGKTWTRWENNENKPGPDKASQVARDIWKTIEHAEGKTIRSSVLGAIERVVPSAPTATWKTAEDCGAWFYQLAEDQNPSDIQNSRPKSKLATAKLQASPHHPFTWLGGISDPDAFFGREKELRKLRDYIRTRSNVQIVGPRRMGKTSLLLAVGHRMNDWIEQPACAFVDMELANCHTLKGWLRCVAREWNWSEPPENLAEFVDHVQVDLRARRRLVLCLDEFEKFKDLAREFTMDFFENLRGCGQAGISILTAARLSLREIRRSGALLSPYYNTFARLDLEPFAEKEALEFVSRSRPDVPKFTDKEVDAILHSAEGHPLRLVFACYEVLEARWNGETVADAIRRGERRADELLPPPV